MRGNRDFQKINRFSLVATFIINTVVIIIYFICLALHVTYPSFLPRYIIALKLLLCESYNPGEQIKPAH